MAETATEETFDAAVKRLLDGRPVSWLAAQTEITDARLRRLLNTSPSARSVRGPTPKEIAAIAAALKVSPLVFLPGGGE